MEDQPSLRAPRPICVEQGIGNQFRVARLPHRPADNAAKAKVEDDGEVEPPLSRLHVRYVANPDAIDAADFGDVKRAGHAVWRGGKAVVRVRGLLEAPRAYSGDPSFLHEALHAFGTHAFALVAKRGVNAGAAVDFSARRMNAANGGLQLPIALHASARWTTAPLIVPGCAHIEEPAHPSHGMLRFLLLDEGAFHLDSLAKNAAAFLAPRDPHGATHSHGVTDGSLPRSTRRAVSSRLVPPTSRIFAPQSEETPCDSEIPSDLRKRAIASFDTTHRIFLEFLAEGPISSFHDTSLAGCSPALSKCPGKRYKRSAETLRPIFLDTRCSVNDYFTQNIRPRRSIFQ